jgi:hypothetical protein
MVPPTALQIISSAGASSSRGQTTPQTTRPDNLSKTQPTGQKAVLANSAAELRTSSEDLTKLPGLDAQIAQLSRDLTLSMNGHADEIRLKYEDALADKEIKEAISHSQIPPHEVAIIRMRNRLYEQRNRITGIDHSARPRRGDRWDAGRF